jgi:hypothetical protein
VVVKKRPSNIQTRIVGHPVTFVFKYRPLGEHSQPPSHMAISLHKDFLIAQGIAPKTAPQASSSKSPSSQDDKKRKASEVIFLSDDELEEDVDHETDLASQLRLMQVRRPRYTSV